MLLTPEGSKRRQDRLWEAVDRRPEWILVADPRHLMYLAGFETDPISLSADALGLLWLGRDGSSLLVSDNMMGRPAEQAHVQARSLAPWYDSIHSAGDRRRATIEHFLTLLPDAAPSRVGLEMQAVPAGLDAELRRRWPNTHFEPVGHLLAALRAIKDPDEVRLIRRSIAAGEAGHARAWTDVRPGMTELEVYCVVERAATENAGRPVVVYGDFASGPRTRQGGRATDRRIEPGDLLLLDFSVVIGGYRGDFTNTRIVAGEPTPRQRAVFDLLIAAMAAGEAALAPGTPAAAVYRAVRGVFDAAGVAAAFPHHAGHGVGLGHPEPPILVPESTDRLQCGNVVTLEPGLYIPEVGGMRIENNYWITADGFERLTHHRIALV